LEDQFIGKNAVLNTKNNIEESANNNAKKLPKKTIKKVKYVGVQNYINADTGEVVEMQVTDIEERDFNFNKIFMQNFIVAMNLIGNQKSKLAFWIIDNLKNGNLLTMTYRQISQVTKISLKTVSDTMQILLEADFLRRINIGCYMVNPNISFKGHHSARMNFLHQYYQTEKETVKKETDEEHLERILTSIGKLMSSVDKLTKEANILKMKISENKKNPDKSVERSC
jgi:uncharacterized protein with HEPN domain